jgi:Ca-activated chloride channel homolog
MNRSEADGLWRLRGFRRAVFPPPRRPLTFLQALPVLLFLAAFGAAVLAAALGHWVLFTNVWPFWLLALMPWVGWMQAAGYGGLSGARGTAALLTRLLVLGVLILALAEPRAVRRTEGLSLVYALDVSDSMGEKVSDASLAYILKTSSAKPEQDEAGLVVFGREAAVELPPRASFPFEVINARVPRDATDLAKALSLSAAMVPEQMQGRVVLVSDGVQTEGDLAGALEELRSRSIPVDVLPVQYDFAQEVWLERLDLPRTVKAGETYEAAVLLSALQDGRGKLVLRENDKTIAEQPVAYTSGRNRFTLPLYLREPGYYEYAAVLEPEPGQDGWRENNTALNFLYLKGEGKVLVVTDPAGDARDAQRLLEALKAARRVVDSATAFEFPREPMSLLPYDAVVFVNAPADGFDAVQLQALRDAAFNQGVGFLMVGGKNSFGPGGYHRTPVEEALPVSMDVSQKKVLPKGALAIVLHTCEFPEGNVWAKRIAKEAIRVLSAKDDVGLLVYGAGGDQWVFPMTPAGEYERLVTLINQCEPSDMPSFATIMQMGVTGLEGSDAAMRHMVIISDGDPSPPPPELVNRFIASKVSVSVVVINPHGGQDVSILQSLAGATGGRYYRVDDPRQLPSIFIKEAKTLKRSLIQNRTFTPGISFPSPILKGIDALPALRGFVLTSPKARSTVILKSPETEDVEPVLATWRFGLGQTAAFTSDLSPNWAADWVAWPRYDAFVQQLLVDISRVERPTHLRMQTFATGDEGIVLVDDDAPEEALLELQAQIGGPRQRSVTLALKQTAPRRYEGRFPLWGRGRYQVALAGAGAGRNETALGGFAVEYSPEYLRFRSDPIVLRRIAEQTGGRLLSGRETGKDLFAVQRVPRETSQPVFPWLLALLAFLIPLDVGIRRVQLDAAAIRGWFGAGRKVESTETLGALLKRKGQVDEALGDARDRTPGNAGPPSLPRATPAPPPAAAAEPAPPTKDPPVSTTERLLAMKRMRSKDREEGGKD